MNAMPQLYNNLFQMQQVRGTAMRRPCHKTEGLSCIPDRECRLLEEKTPGSVESAIKCFCGFLKKMMGVQRAGRKRKKGSFQEESEYDK